jgi:hypothetical protein
MVVANRNSLVLNRSNVVRDVVVGAMGSGRNTVIDQTAASPFSSRLASQQYPQSEAQQASCSAAAWRTGFMPERCMPLSRMGLQRLHDLRVLGLHNGHRKPVKPDGLKPAGGALAASRRRAES